MEQFTTNFLFTDILYISTIQTILTLLIIAGCFFAIYKLQKKNVSAAKITLFSLCAATAIGFGILLINKLPNDTSSVTAINEINNWLSIINNSFVNLMKLLVIPVVAIYVTKAIIDGFKVKSSIKTFFAGLMVLMLMVMMASVIGVIVSLIILPAAELTANAGTAALSLETVTAKQENISGIGGLFASFMPASISEMLSYTFIFGAIVVSIIFGVAIKKTNENKTFIKLIDEASKILDSIFKLIYKAMPYVVLSLIISAITTQGMQALTTGGVLLLTTYVGLGLIFGLQIMINYLIGINPSTYCKKAFKPMILAFSSQSSMGILPVTIDTAANKFGANKGLASIIGATSTQMAFTACSGLWPTIIIIATAMMFGVTLSPAFLIAIIFITPIASLGLPTMPGSATTALVLTMTILGFDPEIIATAMSISFAIEIFADMGRTAINVSGTLTAINVTNKIIK